MENTDLFIRTIENEQELPTATVALSGFNYKIDEYNAPYLAGQTAEFSHEIVELTAEAKLPVTISETDRLQIIGDISHTLSTGSSIIIACTTNFKQAGELAEKMGYRPVMAGEFLQLLCWLQDFREKYAGWFFCYAGRKPGYAILASLGAKTTVIFDTHIGNQVEAGYMNANMDTYCLFVSN